MNHPHKISRKKLMAENKRLTGQLITAQLMTGIVAQMGAVQIAAIQASFVGRDIREGGGNAVEVKQGESECFLGLKEKLENLGNIIKLDNSNQKV